MISVPLASKIEASAASMESFKIVKSIGSLSVGGDCSPNRGLVDMVVVVDAAKGGQKGLLGDANNDDP
jgi:hypothetical protein